MSSDCRFGRDELIWRKKKQKNRSRSRLQLIAGQLNSPGEVFESVEKAN